MSNNDNNEQHKKNNNKHNEVIFVEIWNRIMKNFWSIVCSDLLELMYQHDLTKLLWLTVHLMCMCVYVHTKYIFVYTHSCNN